MPIITDVIDVVVIGGGPAGLGSALSLEALGLNVVIIDPAPLTVLENPSFDGREIALTHHSVTLMREMGAWDRIDPDAISLLKEARVENGEEDHPLTFDTKGKGEDALGYLVPNFLIRKAMIEEVKNRSSITLMAGNSCKQLHCFVDYVQVEHKSGVINAKLAVVADGRFSKIRENLGIGHYLHDFHRQMMVCRMEHELSHEGVALQWFDKGQTVALLPLNHNKISVVLSLPPDEMNKVRALTPEEFNQNMMKRVRNRLGKMKLVSTQHVYPLKTVFANRFETRHTALIGDTAVGMHPITAHGFNLGLVAQEILSQEVQKGMERGEDIGVARQLRHFERRLRLKTMPMFTLTNTIATLYTREEGGLWFLRKAGMRMANILKPIRDKVVDGLVDKQNKATSIKK